MNYFDQNEQRPWVIFIVDRSGHPNGQRKWSMHRATKEFMHWHWEQEDKRTGSEKE